jgi:predicted metal-binding protein
MSSCRAIPVTPVIDGRTRSLCLLPYDGHRRGCPNFGRRAICPPEAPAFFDYFDPHHQIYAVIAEYDLAAHVERMQRLHPDWSVKQAHCCRYWQSTVRKTLRLGIRELISGRPGLSGHVVTECPEAMGVDVTATLSAAGVELEWPPSKIVRKVAMIGKPRPQGSSTGSEGTSGVSPCTSGRSCSVT